uniref:MIP32921p1 n=1 Tax=Drosophila melanogaster TaxID=7227 RepID=G7H838_DROME|nr:MIP32921p1 [Drosophila melanogaster]
MGWLFIRFWGIQIPFIWNTIRLELTSVEWRKGESPEKYFHDNGNADAAKNEFEDPCDSTSVSRSALLFSRTL